MIGEADRQAAGHVASPWHNGLGYLLRQVFPFHDRSLAACEAIGFGATASPSLDHSNVTTLAAPRGRDQSRIDDTAFLVIGTPNDRRDFTTAIRAFALAARRGDRLIIAGCGRHRARLEKWMVALSVENKIAFVDDTASAGQAANMARHDVAIIVSTGTGAAGLCHSALLARRPVLVSDRSAAVTTLGTGHVAGTVFCSGDVVALTEGMLRARSRV